MRSRSSLLDADTAARLDLNDVARGDGLLFVRDGVGMAGRGVAARVGIDEAVAFLAALEHDAPEGAPLPVAVGSVPFVPGAAGSLTVPAVTVVRRADGSAWLIEVEGGIEAPDAPSALAPVSRPQPRAQEFAVRPLTPVERYLAAVTAARDAVRSGALTKAVIAREIEVSSPDPIDVHAVLLRLKATFGRSHRYSIDGFIGASPELLVAVEGSTVRSHPLAGTTPRTGDPDTDQRAAAELLASEKNQVEHRVVIDMIHDTLLPWCSYLDWEPEPSIVTVANVQHLGTAMEGHLSDPRPDAITLVRALSPTPALGGFPRDAALALIAAVEGFDRGRYGGAVGWVDAAGDGTWAVAIRCAELSDDRRTARLVGGGGIVADSEPLAELAETQAKLQAMLSAIVRP
ncbi:MAG: isochorismate synthase [Ilumatobacteraceae bacterium]|jgi:isochorismate synthase